MEYLVVAFLFGLSGGLVGRMKGSSFFVWFLISAVIPVLGLLAALLYRSERDEMRRVCPHCGAVIKLHDAVCMSCGRDQDFTNELIAPQSWGPPVQREEQDAGEPAAAEAAPEPPSAPAAQAVGAAKD
jgi:hypothetical protein